MRVREQFQYSRFTHFLDVDAFERAIKFEVVKQHPNKRGEMLDTGHCPDPWNLHKHGDTTGKFAINRETRRYICWVCGRGSLLDLAMAINDLNEADAETWLYQFVASPDERARTFLSEFDDILYQEKIAKPVMPFYNEHVLDRWTANLGMMSDWLSDRGISSEVAERARLGYQCDAQRRDPTGLQEPYSGPCVYLPHFWGERLVGWQQRWLAEDRPRWVQKYTNTSGFPRMETIYGYEDVYLASRPIILVESVPTRLFLSSLGYPAVALFGSSVSSEQIRLLRRCQQGIVLAPDNDGPGYKWLEHSVDERQRQRCDRVILAKALQQFVQVRVINPVGEWNSGNDLGDLVDEGLPFAAEAVKMLYEEAEYY